MVKTLQKPAGYCPHCEYPIDPGTCPECGADVPSEVLVRSPASVHRRRVVRQTILIVGLCLVMVVGGHMYLHIGWIKWLPAAVLLPFEGDFNGEISIELRRRFEANRLTDEQAREMLKHHIADPVLHSNHKYPQGVPIVAYYQCQYRNDVSSAFRPEVPSPGNSRFFVDGDEVSPASADDLGVDPDYFLRVLQDGQRIWFPPLEEGKHQITLEADFHFRWSYRKSKVVEYTRHCRLSREIEVQGDVLDHVSMIGDASKAEQMKTAVNVIFRVLPSGQTYLSFGTERSPALPLPVAGQVLVRPAPDAGFVPVGFLFLNGESVRYVRQSLSHLPEIKRAPWIAVRVVPDPIVAFLHHANVCFDGVLIWDHVPAIVKYPDTPQVELSRNQRIPLTHVVLNQTVGPN